MLSRLIRYSYLQSLVRDYTCSVKDLLQVVVSNTKHLDCGLTGRLRLYIFAGGPCRHVGSLVYRSSDSLCGQGYQMRRQVKHVFTHFY